MSAYVCDRNHIQYLVQAAMSRGIGNTCGSRMRWYWGNPRQTNGIGQLDYDEAAEVANMLLRENIRSVSYRYDNKSIATLPGAKVKPFTRSDFARVLWSNIQPRQVWHSCRCFSYQACECDDWEQTEAHAFVEALQHAAGCAMAGEVDHSAGEWGAPKPNCNAIFLSSLMR